jgi:hypothetical protein
MEVGLPDGTNFKDNKKERSVSFTVFVFYEGTLDKLIVVDL